MEEHSDDERHDHDDSSSDDGGWHHSSSSDDDNEEGLACQTHEYAPVVKTRFHQCNLRFIDIEEYAHNIVLSLPT